VSEKLSAMATERQALVTTGVASWNRSDWTEVAYVAAKLGRLDEKIQAEVAIGKVQAKADELDAKVKELTSPVVEKMLAEAPAKPTKRLRAVKAAPTDVADDKKDASGNAPA
jgi:hypothetical protein